MIVDIEVLADRYEEQQQILKEMNEHEELISNFVRAMAAENYPEALRIGEEFKAKFGPIDPDHIVGIMKRVTTLRKHWAQEEEEFNSHLGRF